MTCDQLEQVLIGAPLARGIGTPCGPGRAGGRLDRVSLDHVASCLRCATRVQERARVAEALMLLAEADADRRASAAVDAAIAAAWRARQERKAPVGVAGVVPQAESLPQVASVLRPQLARSAATALWSIGHSRAGHWRAAALAAAAAVATIGVASLSVSVMRRAAESSAPAMVTGESSSVEARGGAGKASASAAAKATGKPPAAAQAADQQAGSQASFSEVFPEARSRSARSERVVAPAVRVAPRRRGAPAAPAETAAARTEGHSVAAFVPLPYAEPLRPTEIRQIVRVAVPQDTVVLAGLSPQGFAPAPHTSSEGASDRFSAAVLADVLVGEDGVARGIRPVRPEPSASMSQPDRTGFTRTPAARAIPPPPPNRR